MIPFQKDTGLSIWQLVGILNRRYVLYLGQRILIGYNILVTEVRKSKANKDSLTPVTREL